MALPEVQPVLWRQLRKALFKEITNKIRLPENYLYDIVFAYDELQHEKKDYPKPNNNSFISGEFYDDEANFLISAKKISIEEIVNVVDAVTITEDEANRIVEKIMTDLNSCVKGWGSTGYEFHVYGSYETGLCSIDSDVDFFYEKIKSGWTTTAKYYIQTPGCMSTCLKTQPDLFSEVKYIGSARIPIIKLMHKSTKKNCDISFCESGLKSSRLTKFYVKLNPSLRFLILYLKVVLKKSEIYGTNGITSHVIFWLVVFYLQQKNLLPSVKSVRKKYSDCKKNDLFENWNCSLNEKIDYSSYSYNFGWNCLSTLLFGFAKFYRNFDFTKNVISPYLACVIPIDEFDKWKIPGEIFPSELLRNNNDGKNTFYRHVINIQEPTILSSNLAKNVNCEVLNSFVALCHKLLLNDKFLSPKYLMNLKRLPCRDHANATRLPRDLKRFASITLSLKYVTSNNVKTNPKIFTVLLSRLIHRVMDGALNFQLQTITVEEVIQVEVNQQGCYENAVTVPVIYMKYLSTEKTWNNVDVCKALSYQNPPAELSDKLIEAYFICEFYRLKRRARILIQTTNKNLSTFLQKYGTQIFRA
ncbi:uncharacterized protein LOC135841042 [Planococcus citri]|uniref:uncharacterized protein LOC135841042 n=1 Tax=Planococcus citri TaxID=170843 RepID=UPI0031F91186